MAGLAYWFQPDFFPRLLAALKKDPTGAAHGYYFDVTAWHLYSRASQLLHRTQWVEDQLVRVGIGRKPLWVTETTLPVCGDPALQEETRCTPGSHTGTIEHQAAFVLQALAYAHAAGVEKVFVFQLYDDSLGPGEHYGLVRNDGTPRPALTALRLAAAYLTGSGQADRALSSGGQLELITFRALEDERVRIVWNRSGELVVAGIPMEGSLPLKIDQTGAVQSLETGPGELLQLVLAPATLNDNPRWPPDYIVGGRPLLLVERGVEERPGEIAGLVQDGSGRALAGVPVQVGGYGAVSDGAGAFRVEVPSGLYDVFISPRSAFPPRSQPALSVPVWGGQATTRNLSVQPHQQKMLPFIPYRGRPEPRS